MTIRDRAMKYLLSPETLAKARRIGRERAERHHTRGREHRYGYEGTAEESLEQDVHAAAAELVVANWLKVEDFEPGPELDPEGDVMPGVQVRATEHVNGGLPVHPEDDDLHWFVLVRGTLPRLEIVGWMLGGEAKRDRYWRTDLRWPCYLVPALALHPILR